MSEVSTTRLKGKLVSWGRFPSGEHMLDGMRWKESKLPSVHWPSDQQSTNQCWWTACTGIQCGTRLVTRQIFFFFLHILTKVSSCSINIMYNECSPHIQLCCSLIKCLLFTNKEPIKKKKNTSLYCTKLIVKEHFCHFLCRAKTNSFN